MTNDPPNDPPRGGGRAPVRQPNTYYAKHDPDGSADLTTTVAHALADVMGVDVSGTEFSLYDSVDPDALDRIFAPKADGTPRPPGHVAFGVNGYRVTVYSTGEIAITPP
jgi:hypothetical protein